MGGRQSCILLGQKGNLDREDLNLLINRLGVDAKDIEEAEDYEDTPGNSVTCQILQSKLQELWAVCEEWLGIACNPNSNVGYVEWLVLDLLGFRNRQWRITDGTVADRRLAMCQLIENETTQAFSELARFMADPKAHSARYLSRLTKLMASKFEYEQVRDHLYARYIATTEGSNSRAARLDTVGKGIVYRGRSPGSVSGSPRRSVPSSTTAQHVPRRSRSPGQAIQGAHPSVLAGVSAPSTTTGRSVRRSPSGQVSSRRSGSPRSQAQVPQAPSVVATASAESSTTGRDVNQRVPTRRAGQASSSGRSWSQTKQTQGRSSPRSDYIKRLRVEFRPKLPMPGTVFVPHVRGGPPSVTHKLPRGTQRPPSITPGQY